MLQRPVTLSPDPGPQHKPRIGYLSAAPTVSTHMGAASAGPRAHVLGTINGLRSAGYEVHPFIVGDRMDQAVSGSRRVQAGLERSMVLRLVGDAARMALAKRNESKAFGELSGRVDWVYERFATMQVLGHRFARSGMPWILETQGLFYYETQIERRAVGLPALAERIEKAAYHACDVLVCVSPALKDLLVRECELPPEKILIVPNAVELERFDPEAEPAIRLDVELTLGFVGALIAWQALDMLLDAIAELADEGRRIGLVVVGDGAMREPWQAHAERRGLQDQVQFVGQVPGDRVASYMAGCDLGYAGARTMQIGTMYHSPIKLYEYMAMGRPVLAAAHDDARCLVEGHDTGFLFEADDPESLRATLREAHEARHRLGEMGSAARKLIEREHSWKVRASDMIARAGDILDRSAKASLFAGDRLAVAS